MISLITRSFSMDPKDSIINEVDLYKALQHSYWVAIPFKLLSFDWNFQIFLSHLTSAI